MWRVPAAERRSRGGDAALPSEVVAGKADDWAACVPTMVMLWEGGVVWLSTNGSSTEAGQSASGGVVELRSRFAEASSSVSKADDAAREAASLWST
ncbi:unnamed protein product [Phytophthora fragariaefolia]|uniref:Unnamed protein product n=1 Tax=Phytophthora fragariaefolia TaxID=1490495 RepID=A0A9W6X6C8_9STRA|nr:unnamed protein product [Phytophthora fragariaefolia]